MSFDEILPKLANMLPILASVLGTFLIIGLGAVCRRVGWLTQQADTSLAKLTANVMLPAYFFANFTASDKLDSLAQVWLPPVIGFATTALGFGFCAMIAWSIGPKIGLDTDAKRRAFTICARASRIMAISHCRWPSNFIPRR